MSGKVFKYEPIPTTYAGVKYRSRVEARWALFFDAMNVRFQYEFEGFNIRGGGYLPDFWLPGFNMFLEVKGKEPSAEEAEKCADLTQASEADVLIAIGAPEERFQIMWFDREGQRDGLYVFAVDKVSECGFWLVGEPEHDDDNDIRGRSNWIGPSRTALLPKGPMFSGALEQAYAAAQSARFDASDDLRRVRVQPIGWEPDRRAAWWLAA